MREIKINSFEDFHKTIKEFIFDRNWIFRGQQSTSWPLIPKLGRKEYKKLEYKPFFAAFKRRAIEFTTMNPENDWDWLAIGQHHGLPTMLLDWTFNPLIAAYFAAYPYKDEDCAIYAYRPKIHLVTDTCKPEDFKGVIKIHPRGILARICRQGGQFTYHNPPDLDVEKALEKEDQLIRLLISKKYRKTLIFELDKYCINQMTLFPDMDGLAGYMAWSCRDDVSSFWRDKISEEEV